ncbi:PAP2 superfamily protein [Actinomadura pelletieri DSM 43383]|uniref:PAP2 superfamily protein n=1 Tax=Actinomadura pelletieri DSM 43383 TaxID=1120940 RepID=A0A495QP36_9ACTN|nr:phosphatase PAP2 family protein [Actinomadura pelletieri]RKS74701.1 PAP2 superfamily protein [Actinomadura pelletieri DSM 43383]
MAQPPPHTAAATTRRRVLTAPPVWRELLLVVLFYAGYTLTRIVLVQDGTGPAFAHADEILGVERALGIDIELSLNHTLLSVPWLARTANVFYATMHFIVTLGVVLWLYRYRPQHYRWLRTSIMVATGLALIGFWLYPLAPPRFLHSEGFVDPVTALHSLGLYASDASGTLTNQYAAMPSMHAGWSLWCGLILAKLATQKWAKALGALYPVTTVYVILATANHYVLDAVAGTALVGGALWVSWILYTRCPRPLVVAWAHVSARVALRARPSTREARPGATAATRAAATRSSATAGGATRY